MQAGLLAKGFGIVVCAVATLSWAPSSAEAKAVHGARHASARAGSHGRSFARVWHPTWQRSALQCVPFARENSGIELSGNAGTWWGNAAGLYERGARPEVGSILNFRSTSHMRMGHVAVVANVITPRHIEIDHANWGAPGRVSRNIDVVDVSPNNDWTTVRVALNGTEDYGSDYPTYGFIYDRPDHGTMIANDSRAPIPTLRPAPSDTTLASNADLAPEEVAEAAEDDDGSPAPRYSGRHHHAGHGARTGSRFVSAAGHSRFAPPSAASTYRVSTHGAVAKPLGHKPSRRHA